MQFLETVSSQFVRLRRLGAVHRYAVAFPAVLAATGLQLLVFHPRDIAPFVLFFLVVAVVSVVGGVGPGILSVALSALFASHYFIEPYGGWGEQHVQATAMFCWSAGSIALLCGLLRETWFARSDIEQDLNYAQEVAGVGSWRTRPGQAALVLSDETYRIFGVPHGTYLDAATFLAMVHPLDRSRVDEAWKAAVHGAPYEVEHRIEVDGRTKWVRQRARLSFDARGALLAGFGTVQDVTDQKAAEETQRLSQELFRTMFESAGAAITRVNLSTGALVQVNRRFAQLTGYSIAELQRMSYLDLVHPDERGETLANMAQGRTGVLDDGYFGVRRYVRKDGRVVEVEVHGTAVRDPRGNTVCAMLVVIDVTQRNAGQRELEHARAAAEEASRAKDRFLAVLSHELRTPLTPVVNGLTILGVENLSPRGRQMLTVMRRNLDLETRLIDDLLDLTRIARGRMALDLATVDLRLVVERAVEVCRAEIEARDVELSVDCGTRACAVNGDAARLQQVVWNLLKNAVKFTPAGGRIAIRCGVERAEAVIEVSDTGLGIEPGALPAVFDAFAEPSRAPEHGLGGLGVGLALSRSIVQTHGGRLEATSEGAGTGATFRAFLPLVAAVEAAAAPVVARAGATASPCEDRRGELGAVAASGRAAAAAAAAGEAAGEPHGAPREAPRGCYRILIVEDNADTAETCATAMELAGHRVSVAAEAAGALELIENGTFDLLVSDLGLPGRSGIELLGDVRARGHQLPAIAITGYGSEQDRRDSADAGFAVHLVKPVEPCLLLGAISRVMGEAGAEGAPAAAVSRRG